MQRGSRRQRLVEFARVRHLEIHQEWAASIRKVAQALISIRRYDLAKRLLEPAARSATSEKIAARYDLAELLSKMDQTAQAVALWRKICAEEPWNWSARRALAAQLHLQQDYEAEIEILSSAPPEVADAPDVLWDLTLAHLYGPDLDAKAYTELARRWSRAVSPFGRAPCPMRSAKPIVNRKMRIGYAQPYFHFPSYLTGAAQTLTGHDRSQVTVYGYDFGPRDLPRPPLLNSLFDVTRFMDGLTPVEASNLICDDNLDILVDMTGFDFNCPVEVYKLRPAPILATWYNALGTFGGDLFDYIIGDEIVCPPVEDHLYSEKVVRLPRPLPCVAMGRHADAPDVAPPPCLKNGFIVFGCFNRPYKINKITAQAWAEILYRVPDSLLFLRSHSFSSSYQRTRVLKLLSEHGIRPGSVRLLGFGERSEFFASFNQVDIALDPIGFSGGLSTVEALFQGVPVVALRGGRWAGRLSASFLTSAGLPELVADDVAGYVDLACSLAKDSQHLAQMRGEMRSRVTQSALCDGRGVAAALEGAYRQMIEAAAS